ncbi:MAG: hypothetical protein NDI69_15850 [Bacteriovoracaceae bacterium]|nr:hypothetical protein [Bacteriovoracaceae bacterium]
MQTKIGKGIIGGLIAGVIFGFMMQMMMVPTPEGQEMPMMAMVAQVVRSESLFVGWVYHLFNSAIIGGIFGWTLGKKAHSYGSGTGWGALYGIAWWVVGGLILMPMFLGMNAFAPLVMEPMRAVAMGSLMGHLIYGIILGASYFALAKKSVGKIHYKDERTA